jgi:hypothetical protein
MSIKRMGIGRPGSSLAPPLDGGNAPNPKINRFYMGFSPLIRPPNQGQAIVELLIQKPPL